MNKKNSTKRSLITSVLTLVLCMSMLIGSTFAWFTDSVVSRNNIIKSGNLDIELEYSLDGDTWNEVAEDTALFKEDDLWEPGHTVAVALRVKNVGTLAFKYAMSTNVYSEKEGTNVYGETFKLSEYLNVGHSAIQQAGSIGDILMGLVLGSRDSATSASGMTWVGLNNTFSNPNPVIFPGEAHVVALAITMPTTVGNEANYKTGTDAPYIQFGVELYATQTPYEDDSFGTDYDKNAEFPYVVTEPDALIAALQNGEDVTLGKDMDMEAEITAPYGNKVGLVQKGGTFDGNGNKLSVECYGDDYGIMTYGGTIKNLTIDNGFRGIVSMSPTEDVILENVHIGGDGVGYAFNTAEHPTVAGIDLVATNSSFSGWSSFAGFESASFKNCTFGVGSYYNNWPYDQLVKPYADTTFSGCNFAEDYYLDLSALGTGCIVTLENCTVNGTVITADNCTTLFGEVELSGGRTLADCVVFK